MSATTPQGPSLASPTSSTADQPAWRGALSGLLAAGAALGVAELFSGFTKRIPSLVVAVGDIFVDNTPGSVVRRSIDTLGTNQKPALVWGITLTALLVGALLGMVAQRRFVVGAAGLGLFGIVGGVAAARYPQSSVGLSWLAAIVATAIGVAVLWVLLQASGSWLASPRVATDQTMSDRRRFLTLAGAAAFVGLFGAGLGRRLRERFGVEAARNEVATRLSTAAAPLDGQALRPTEISTFSDVGDISPIITPNHDFYRIDTALSVPQIDPESWSLQINGLVDQPLQISFDELLAMDMVERNITLSCVSNEVGGHLVGNARWQGVPLSDLLDQAGISPECTQIVGRSFDKWTAGFPTEIAFDGRPALVAVAMNDEPLPVDHGFPARLVVAGLYGYVSATKWLTEIECTTWEAFDAYWVPRGWSKEGPMKTQSRIDTPRRSRKLTPGTTAIAGVAWAPNRGIQAVEVQVDDEPWQPAELSDELSIDSWRQWLVRWDATPGDHRIRVRATDTTGETQTGEESAPAPDGATGWHTINVSVEA